MELGFVTAIVPDLELPEVLHLAAKHGYDCVEVMCWPRGRAERRYAGVTHLDVEGFDTSAAESVHELCGEAGVTISALGYYANPLSPVAAEAELAADQIRKVILAAELLGVGMNTFVGRDHTLSVDANWPRLVEVWRPLVQFAYDHGVRVGIENCPMSFTADEWPGGKNLAVSPAIWRRMFNDIPGENFGLNYDPSHMIWQQMDPIRPLQEFSDRLFHIHAKDARLDRGRLDEVGILASPNDYHTPKLPGMGDVDWGRFFSILTDLRYPGAVCVEVEDRAYEDSPESREAALWQSQQYLRQYVPRRRPAR